MNKTKMQTAREIMKEYGGPELIQRVPMVERLQVASKMAEALGKDEVSKKLLIRAASAVIQSADDVPKAMRLAKKNGLGEGEVQEAILGAFNRLLESGHRKEAMEIAEQHLGEDEKKKAAVSMIERRLRCYAGGGGYAPQAFAEADEIAEKYGIGKDEVRTIAKRVFEGRLRDDDYIYDQQRLAERYLGPEEKWIVERILFALDLVRNIYGGHPEGQDYLLSSEERRMSALGFSAADVKETAKLACDKLIQEGYLDSALLVAARWLGKEEVEARRIEAIKMRIRDDVWSGKLDSVEESAAKAGLGAEFIRGIAAEAFPVLMRNAVKKGHGDSAYLAMGIAERLLGAEELRVAAKEVFRLQLKGGHVKYATETVTKGKLAKEDVMEVAKSVCKELMAIGRAKEAAIANYIAYTWLGEEEKKRAAEHYISLQLKSDGPGEPGIKLLAGIAEESGLKEKAMALRKILELQA